MLFIRALSLSGVSALMIFLIKTDLGLHTKCKRIRHYSVKRLDTLKNSGIFFIAILRGVSKFAVAEHE